jgi:hypothetical protein
MSNLATVDYSLTEWRTLARIAGHVVIATLIFLVAAAPAVTIDILVRHLEAFRISIQIVWGLKFIEYASFAGDIILYCVFLWKTVIRLSRAL